MLMMIDVLYLAAVIAALVSIAAWVSCRPVQRAVPVRVEPAQKGRRNGN